MDNIDNIHRELFRLITMINNGKLINETYVLADCNACISSSGKTYLTGKVRDKSGSIGFKVWSYSGNISNEDNGSFVRVKGVVRSYNSKMQIIADEIELVDKINLSEEDMKRLIPYADIDPKEKMKYVWEKIEEINDSDLYNMTKYLITKYEHEFETIPAAKSNHHACVHGLLQHTSEMLLAADSFCKIYGFKISKSLLFAGVILHDIGKIKEFCISDKTGLVSEYTFSGLTLGHSILGLIEVEEAAKSVNASEEKKRILQNVIASHHGNPEYGAAKSSCVLEADIVHALDMADSRTEIIDKEKHCLDKFSPVINSLGKSVYKHTIDYVPDRLDSKYYDLYGKKL